MSIQKYQYDSAQGTMAFALVKSGIVPNERRLIMVTAEAIKPKYSFDKAPKLERHFDFVSTVEKKKEIMNMIPATVACDKKFRKNLRIAAIVALAYEGLCKFVSNLKKAEDDVINEAYYSRLMTQIEKKEEQLSYHLDCLGI